MMRIFLLLSLSCPSALLLPPSPGTGKTLMSVFSSSSRLAEKLQPYISLCSLYSSALSVVVVVGVLVVLEFGCSRAAVHKQTRLAGLTAFTPDTETLCERPHMF